MKSIMEEASSIIKAIEKGWAKAGQPKEFSVKVFEEPQKNFIGMTTRSAKIGIFFNETVKQDTHTGKFKQTAPQGKYTDQETSLKEYTKQPTRTRKINTQRATKEPVKPEPVKPEDIQPPVTAKAQEVIEQKPLQPVWTEAMLLNMKEWIAQILGLLNAPQVNFSLEPNHFHLRIKFDGPVLAEREREKQLFASLATLILQMLKHEYKRPLKGYKLILIGA